MSESNTVVSAYTMYRHLQQYCSNPSIQRYPQHNGKQNIHVLHKVGHGSFSGEEWLL